MSEKIFVFSNPVAGREEECNEWYNTVHLQEVANVEGVTSAQRFALHNSQLTDGDQPYRYVAIYEVDEAVGAEQTIEHMMAAAGSMNMSDSLDTDNAYVTVMRAITEKVVGRTSDV